MVKIRQLLRKIEKAYGAEKLTLYSLEEEKEIEKSISIGLLNQNAFNDVMGFGDTQKRFIQLPAIYPLSPSGKVYLDRNVLVRIKDSKILAPIAVILTAVIGIGGAVAGIETICKIVKALLIAINTSLTP